MVSIWASSSYVFSFIGYLISLVSLIYIYLLFFNNNVAKNKQTETEFDLSNNITNPNKVSKIMYQ